MSSPEFYLEWAAFFILIILLTRKQNCFMIIVDKETIIILKGEFKCLNLNHIMKKRMEK